MGTNSLNKATYGLKFDLHITLARTFRLLTTLSLTAVCLVTSGCGSLHVRLGTNSTVPESSTATSQPTQNDSIPILTPPKGFKYFNPYLAYTTSRGKCQEDGFRDWNCYAVKVISSTDCSKLTVDLNTLNENMEITGNDFLVISNIGKNQVARLEGGDSFPGSLPPRIAVSSIECISD